MSAGKRDNDPGREALENEFRAMFAERSETVRMTTAPYASVRRRIVAARRKRRMRIGSAGVAFAVAVVGVGVWAAVPARHHAAVAPISTDISHQPASGTPAKFVYADGHTELPAGALRDAALGWLRSNYGADLSGLTVVTTFDQGIQTAAAAKYSPYDAGVAVVDARTGAVVALSGYWDRPLPIADLMKPVVLAAAFETGHYTPESTEPLDAQTHPLYYPVGATQPMTYATPGGPMKYWPAESPTTTIHDIDVTLTQAAESGANEPFAQLELAHDMGPKAVYEFATGIGMPKYQDLVPVPSLALGVAQETPLTMASVYATFADGGVHRDPRMVGELLAPGGRTVWEPAGTGTRVMSQNTAQQVVGVLHAAMLGGPTGTGIAPTMTNPGSSVGAMAAAPDTEKAAWVDGADSNYVVSVGLSTMQGGSLQRLATDGHGGLDVGSRIAGPTWANVVRAVRNHG